MKLNNTVVETPGVKLLFTLLLLTLSGCGNEDTSTINSGAATNNDETLSLQAAMSLEVGTSFENYYSKQVSISPPVITGDKLFLKLNRESGELLFLGEVDRFQVFYLLVNVLLDEKRLKYEFFSNDTSDQTLDGEVTL